MLNELVVKTYVVKDIKYGDVKIILRKYIVDYRNKFVRFAIMVEWEVLLKDNSKLIIKRKEAQDQRYH